MLSLADWRDTMNPKTDLIPGLRTPTAQEQNRISEYWVPVLRKHWHPTSGKLLKFFSYFFFAVGAVRMVRDPSAVVEMAFFFLLGGAVLFFSKLSKKASRDYTALYEAIQKGDYQVAPVYATKLEGTYYGNDHSVIATLELADGEPIKGLFRVPPKCAQSYPRNAQIMVPALLIFVDAKNELLAIL